MFMVRSKVTLSYARVLIGSRQDDKLRDVDFQRQLEWSEWTLNESWQRSTLNTQHSTLERSGIDPRHRCDRLGDDLVSTLAAILKVVPLPPGSASLTPLPVDVCGELVEVKGVLRFPPTSSGFASPSRVIPPQRQDLESTGRDQVCVRYETLITVSSLIFLHPTNSDLLPVF